MENSGLPSFTEAVLIYSPPLEKETERAEIFPLEQNSIGFLKERKGQL